MVDVWNEGNPFSPERLRGHRERQRITQGALGRMVGRSVSTIRNWERGRGQGPGLVSIGRLATALGVGVGEFFRQHREPDEDYRDARFYRAV